MFRFTNIYIIASIIACGGLLQGFDVASLGAILTSENYIKYYSTPSSSTQGGITASISGGSFLGCHGAFWTVDRIGRRAVMQIGCVIFVIGAILCAASVDVAMLIVGRVICGFAVGMFTSTGPTYLAELSPKTIRGRVVAFQPWASTWGSLIMYFITYGATFTHSNASFRIPWSVQILPALLMFAGLFFVPRSPRWLASMDRWEEALDVLTDLHGHGDVTDPLVQAEYAEIKEAMEIRRAQGDVRWSELVERVNIQRISSGIFVHIYTQLSGNNAVLYYVVYIFAMAGLTDNTKLIAAAVQYVILVVMTLPAILFLDHMGRRPALLFGSVMMAGFLFATAALFKVYGNYVPGGVGGSTVVNWIVHGNASKGVIACTYLLIAVYSFTWNPIGWVYPPEIFPMRLRGKAVCIAASANWIFGFANSYFAPPAFANIQWKTFIIFGVFNVVAFFHCFFFFVETKRRSLEDIDELFAKGVNAWQSQKLAPHDRLDELVQNPENIEKLRATYQE